VPLSTASTAFEANSCKRYGCVPYAPQHGCQCNDLCSNFGDCCEDYEGVCRASSSRQVTTTLESTVTGTSSSRAAPGANGTENLCCMAARSPQDICGTCYPASWAPASNWCGQSKDRCEGCGKSWCTGVTRGYTESFMKKYGCARLLPTAS
jgi:hypothetical protein